MSKTIFTVTLQSIPGSDDVFIELPEYFLIKENWVEGDELKVDIVEDNGVKSILIVNCSKEKRQSEFKVIEPNG